MECPSCHEDYDEVYQCEDCDRMFCFGCKEVRIIDAITLGLDGGIGGWCCPKCGGRGVTIASKDEEPRQVQKEEVVEKRTEDDADVYDGNSCYIGTRSSADGCWAAFAGIVGSIVGGLLGAIVGAIVGAIIGTFLGPSLILGSDFGHPGAIQAQNEGAGIGAQILAIAGLLIGLLGGWFIGWFSKR